MPKRPGSLHAPFFSVVMPTRDRPALFKAALDSVLAQTCNDFEVIVVDDGSSELFQGKYSEIESATSMRRDRAVTFIHLRGSPHGHGPCFALNTGASYGSGRYLCFLDDDDLWIDPGYLDRTMQTLSATEDAVDLMFSDQVAFRGGDRLSRPIWLEDLGVRLKAAGPGLFGDTYVVDVEQLLTATGFCHVNSMIVRAGLFAELGFDERLIYEGDRDFFLRAIDRAELMLYRPHPVAQHHVPVPILASNISTRVTSFTRRLCQVMLLHGALRTARHPAIKAYAKRHRSYALRRAIRAVRSARDAARLGSVFFVESDRRQTPKPTDRDYAMPTRAEPSDQASRSRAVGAAQERSGFHPEPLG